MNNLNEESSKEDAIGECIRCITSNVHIKSISSRADGSLHVVMHWPYLMFHMLFAGPTYLMMGVFERLGWHLADAKFKHDYVEKNSYVEVVACTGAGFLASYKHEDVAPLPGRIRKTLMDEAYKEKIRIDLCQQDA